LTRLPFLPSADLADETPIPILGLAVLGYFLVKDRARIAETRRVFTEETPTEKPL
jgi:hypothetical protein